MCITQAEMFGQEYEEAKLKGLENKTKNGAYSIIIM
jgi:hypothetical protein